MLPGGVVGSWELPVNTMHQRTATIDTLFPFIRREKRLRRMPEYWLNFFDHQDLGATFLTEKAWHTSNYSNHHQGGQYFGQPWQWSIEDGPLLLTGFGDPISFQTKAEQDLENTIVWALGGTAIARTRPGKPVVDIANTLGEMRREGIPSLVGSLWARSRTFKELFKNSGDEYLNLTFGWAPLIRDLEGLCKVVLSTRELLEAHQKQMNVLIRRTYSFDTIVETKEGLTRPKSEYEITPAQQAGTYSYFRSNVQLNGQVPTEIKRTVTTSHFSAGYRFFYPDLETALDDLRRFEADANTLLGTRLDPEVLWNLTPWTWLVDWFLNFGDVVGNISAIAADNLVIQYAYLMRETVEDREVYLPRGFWFRDGNNTQRWNNKPYLYESRLVRKKRSKSSPFGFGLTPEMFTPQQWAILAALGISHGLK
jgi:hypothetical protein